MRSIGAARSCVTEASSDLRYESLRNAARLSTSSSNTPGAAWLLISWRARSGAMSRGEIRLDRFGRQGVVAGTGVGERQARDALRKLQGEVARNAPSHRQADKV